MNESESFVSSMEMTKNPFESDLEEKLNYPGFSPSMFTAPKTPVNKKQGKEFRWSIEQISRLYPVDMEEYPNQEYSSTYERDEDEKAAQDAITEYFSQDAIVPSPWTPNRSVKHVTFSPLPPDTQYIASDCSMNSSYSTQNNSIRIGKVEAGTQTALSIPLNVDLEEILGSAFQTFMSNDLNNSKDLSGSSLRRNLFPYDEEMQRKNDVNNNQQNAIKIRSILKSSKSPTLTTSSPVSGKQSQKKEERTSGTSTPCPDVSPIRAAHNTPLNKVNNSRLSMGYALHSPLATSHVLESSGIEKDLEMFPDISPIKHDQLESEDEDVEQKELQNKSCNDSHYVDVEPVKLSALSTNENQANNNTSSNGDDSISSNDSDDSDKPAKITMEDLASEYSIDQEYEEPQHEEKPPGVSIEDLQSHNGISMVKETDKELDDAEAMETSMTNILSSTKIPDSIKQHDQESPDEKYFSKADESLWDKRPQVRNRFHVVGFEGSGKDLDSDLVMVKASAALRRADRFTQSIKTETEHGFRNKTCSYSISSMNISELPGQPVSMSTPLTMSPMLPRAFGSSFDNEFVRFETQTQFGNLRSDVFSQTSYNDNSVYQSRNATKRLSPVIEDVLRRKEILKSCLKEVQSNEWNPVTPTYESPGKWKTPRTYPLSHADRRAVYGRPSYRFPDNVDTYSPQLYTDSRYNSKRTSWPPSRSFPPRQQTVSRPLLPTNRSSTTKIYSTNPEGCVSRMPLPKPYPHNYLDSGFDEWKKSIDRWEKYARIQNIKLT